MTRPLIGITMDASNRPLQYALNHDYAKAVENAGGMPYPLSYMLDASLIGELVDRLDGVLLIGGDDLNPSRYGQERDPNTQPLDEHREAFEFALLKEVESRRLPVLGICLGSQIMNVHRGGSLHQFLPELQRSGVLEHRKLELTNRRHPARLDPASALAQRLGKVDLNVNTSHKQSMDKIGRGLRIIATAPDGVIEGLEDPSLPFFLALQWHPERLAGEVDHEAPFQMLVEKAREHAQTRSPSCPP